MLKTVVSVEKKSVKILLIYQLCVKKEPNFKFLKEIFLSNLSDVLSKNRTQFFVRV